MELAVALILDPSFGPRLNQIDAKAYIWIRDSEINESLAKERREILKRSNDPRPDVVTTFNYSNSLPLEAVIKDILPTIWEHQRWTVLDLYGSEISDDLRKLFSEIYGVTVFRKTEFGYRLERSSRE